MYGLEKMNWFGRIVERNRENFLASYLKSCPTLFHLCYDPIGTHKKARRFVGFFLGLFLGIVFYVGIILDLQFDPYTSLALGAIVIVLLSIGCASSIQVNAISQLFSENYDFLPYRTSPCEGHESDFANEFSFIFIHISESFFFIIFFILCLDL